MNDDLLVFAEELARVAASSGGLQALAARLAAHLDAAVLIEDADRRHLALAGAGTRALPPSSRDLTAATPRRTGSLARLTVPGALDAYTLPIALGEATLGHLTIFPHRAATAEPAGAARLAAAALGLEMARDNGGGKNRRKSFWERLVSGAYDDPIEAAEEASTHGIRLAAGYVAVAIEAEGLADETDAPGKLADLRRLCAETLRSGGAEIASIERGGAIVFLCPASLEIDAANVRTAASLIPRAVAKAHLGVKPVGGVGRRADAIAMRRGVEEAREALFITRRLFGSGRVTPYDELGTYPLLLRGCAAEELRAFAARALAPLKAYDEKHQAELVRTLRLYFERAQNVKTTAAELSVHRHTVFYRLRQIAEIGGHDLDTPHGQLTLRTALAIDALTI